MPHKHVELSQTGFQGRPHHKHEHIAIHRLNDEIPVDKSHYLMAAVAEFHAGEPVPVHYPGPTVAYVIEGEINFEDKSKPGQVTKLVAGDILHIDQETDSIFSTPSKAKLFGASYSPGLHPEDYVGTKN